MTAIATIPVIVGAGFVAFFVIAAFRAYGRRKWKVSDEYRSTEDHTKWVYVNGRKVPPVRPDQLIVYTGTARVHAIESGTVDAEVVSYEDERLVKR